MSISEIPTSETGFEESAWGDSYNETSSFIEFGGSEREIRRLQEEYEMMNQIAAILHRNPVHKHSLHTRSIIHNSCATSIIRPKGGSVSGEIEISWGDKDGVSVSGGVSAEAHDDNGNYAKIEVNQDSDGKGSAKISAGHKEE